MFLKNYTGNVEQDLSLTFTVSEQAFGVTRDVDLIPKGSTVTVTKENRIRYIYLVANYKLNTKIARQCTAFFQGLIDLIHPAWLKMFNHHELQILLGGKAVPIEIKELQDGTTYGV